MSRLTLQPNRMLALTLLLFSVVAASTTARAQYKVMNLVTTNTSIPAPHHDANLKNAWGLSFLPMSPFWVSDEATGKTTVYLPSGSLPLLTVTVPPASGTGKGRPTGQVANPNNNIFMVKKGTKKGPAAFIFATLDGTISGWAPNVDMNNAIIAARMAGANFTGLAIATVAGHTFLGAADAAHNTVDVFDSNFKLVRSSTVPHPPGLAVYGIQTINGKIYITLGALGSTAGAVDVFNPSTGMLKRLITNGAGGHLQAPWGLAISPSNFGHFSNALLVGNVANGWINAFNPSTGKFLGTLKNTTGKPIALSGLWALEFGGGSVANNGQKNELFFTSGPSGYTLGVFGVIKP